MPRVVRALPVYAEPTPAVGPTRPVVRGDCASVARPCVWRSCRWHLWRDAGPNQYPGSSCALDVADLGGSTLDVVGHALGVTRERVRQIEDVALGKLGPEVARI